MPDNIAIRDALGASQTMKTTEDGGVHTPHHSFEPQRGAFTDRSGTINIGATSQQLAPANPNRRFLFVQNLSAGDLWINFGAPATQGQPSIKLRPEAAWCMELNVVSTDQVTIIGAAAGQAYAAKET